MGLERGKLRGEGGGGKVGEEEGGEEGGGYKREKEKEVSNSVPCLSRFYSFAYSDPRECVYRPINMK